MTNNPPEQQLAGHVAGQSDVLGAKTVADFGAQWRYFTENQGYYASDAFFADLVAPLLNPAAFQGVSCAEIGAGTGNIAAMALRAGAAHFVAVAPSDAVHALRENLAEFGPRAEIIHALGQDIPARDFDIVLSIGVLHHIPLPDPVVKAAYDALKPGGRMFNWLYGAEGNTAYLRLALPLRAVTRQLPIWLLSGLSYGLDAVLMPLVLLARRGYRVPLAAYLRDVYGKLSAKDRRVVIVDQLKPAWALYYTQEAAVDLLARAGFQNVAAFHRHGYSWSVLGQKPDATWA